MPNEYKIEIITEGDDAKTDIAGFFYDYLEKEENWKQSGHIDIFKYKMKSFTPDQNGDIKNDNDLIHALGVVAIMVYHNKLASVVVAVKEDVLKKIRS